MAYMKSLTYFFTIINVKENGSNFYRAHTERMNITVNKLIFRLLRSYQAIYIPIISFILISIGQLTVEMKRN